MGEASTGFRMQQGKGGSGDRKGPPKHCPGDYEGASLHPEAQMVLPEARWPLRIKLGSLRLTCKPTRPHRGPSALR